MRTLLRLIRPHPAIRHIAALTALLAVIVCALALPVAAEDGIVTNEYLDEIGARHYDPTPTPTPAPAPTVEDHGIVTDEFLDEIEHHLPDSDGDGLSDSDEVKYAADPYDWDTDNDGIGDGDEIHRFGTFPFAADTEGDGLNDADELFVYGTNPLDPDTDNDWHTDGQEVRNGTDPLDSASA